MLSKRLLMQNFILTLKGNFIELTAVCGLKSVKLEGINPWRTLLWRLSGVYLKVTER
nr:MAG: hypothetical protein [Actinidia virus 1]